MSKLAPTAYKAGAQCPFDKMKRSLFIDSKFFDDYSFEDLIERINLFTSINITDVKNLSGSSIYVKDITELSELQQKNFLNFIEMV